MDWNAALDLYCERTAPGLFNEPLNLLSNGAFIAAGWLIRRNLLRRPLPDLRWQFLCQVAAILMIVVGIGSAIFHSVATAWAQVADVAPIGVFVFYFLVIHVLAVVARGWRGVAWAMAGLVVASIFFGVTVDPMLVNGSQEYFGPCLVLIVLSVLHARKHLSSGKWMLAGCGLFLGALTMRSVDLAICEAWPLGTHFLWHLCNGILLYALMRGLLGYLREQVTGN